jgi:hypothetical protein
MVGDKTAIAVRLFVEVPDGWQAKVCKVATQFAEFSSLNISASRSSGRRRAEEILRLSPCVRHDGLEYDLTSG